MKYTENYWDKIDKLKNSLNEADKVIIGAGAGLSTSAGLTYSGERFYKYFSDFANKYGIEDIYSGGFYPFPDLETYWAWWSRHIWYNRYEVQTNNVYKNLLKLVENKDYFVLTTNVDHQFQLSGFDKNRLFYTQGDYGLFQCSKGCHNKTYDNKDIVEKMIKMQNNMRIPSELVPHCPVCGAPMTVNLRCDYTFVQDEGWYRAEERYNSFLKDCEDLKVLYLELGVGNNTPVIIKYPFWRAVAKNKKAVYSCINLGNIYCPKEIEERAVCISEDIAKVIEDIMI